MPYRLAAIAFLNAAPLMYGLESDPDFELRHASPADCAAWLASGAADLGVIPAVELVRLPGLVGIGSLGVAARTEVRSILLIARRPLPEVRSLALDRSSRTSSALVQILLRRRFGARFELHPGGADWRHTLATCDAALLIGDPALQLSVNGEAAAAGFAVHDLAALWHAWTGLPFVFALWGVRREAVGDPSALVSRLRRSLAAGLAARAELVRRWAPRLALPEPEIDRYLRADVEYHLDAGHRAGLLRFLELARAEGLLAPAAGLPPLLDEAAAPAAAAPLIAP